MLKPRKHTRNHSELPQDHSKPSLKKKSRAKTSRSAPKTKGPEANSVTMLVAKNNKKAAPKRVIVESLEECCEGE
jgi:hypothetical protein